MDSERIFMSTWNMVAEPMGYRVPENVLMDNRGKSKAYGRQNLLQAMGEDFPIDVIEAERKVLNEKIFFEEKNIVKPGVKELLNWMKERHMASAVASARVQRVTTEHLKHADIYEAFDVVIGGDMVSNNKPEPDLFLKAAEMLGVKPEECLVIGDTISDMKAAKAAKMKAAFIEDMVPADEEVTELADVFLARIDMVIPMIEERKTSKWKVSVQTARWFDEKNPNASMKYIRDCGFEAVDYSLDSLFKRSFDAEKLTSFFDKTIPELEEYYRPLKESAREHGISFDQAHGILVTYYKDNPKKTEYCMKVTEKMLAVCQYLECPAIVIHPWIGGSLGADKEEEKKVNMQVYRRLMPAAKKYGIKICLENLWDKKEGEFSEAPCVDPKEACEYIDRLNDEAGMEIFGFCLDVGHVLLYQKDICEFVKIIGNRLTLLHIHENDGRTDSHLIPFTQVNRTGIDTCVEWEDFMSVLREVNYEGNLSFETFNAITVMPAEMKAITLQLISNIGKYFRKQLGGM